MFQIVGAVIGAAIAAAFGLFLIIILSTLLGGVTGWVVGWAFPEILSIVKEFIGVDITDFQLGAALGFFGSFFRSSSVSSS